MLFQRGFVCMLTLFAVSTHALFAENEEVAFAHLATIGLRVPAAYACLAYENDADTSVRKHASHALFYALHLIDDAMQCGRSFDNLEIGSDLGWGVYDAIFALIYAKKAWQAFQSKDAQKSFNQDAGFGYREKSFWEKQRFEMALRGDVLQNFVIAFCSGSDWLFEFMDGWDEQDDEKKAKTKALLLLMAKQFGCVGRIFQEACLAQSGDIRRKLAIPVGLSMAVLGGADQFVRKGGL